MAKLTLSVETEDVRIYQDDEPIGLEKERSRVEWADGFLTADDDGDSLSLSLRKQSFDITNFACLEEDAVRDLHNFLGYWIQKREMHRALKRQR